MIVGIVLLLFGVSVFLRAFFNIHIPLLSGFFALVIIYWSLKMLLGNSWNPFGPHRPGGDVVFSSEDFALTSFGRDHLKKFNTVFGASKIDLSALKLERGGGDLDLQINTVFGDTRVILNPSTPVGLEATAVFGNAAMPDHNSVAFGTLNYGSEMTKNTGPMLHVHGHVIFGSFRFELKKKPGQN